MGYEGYVRVLAAGGEVLDLARASLGEIDHQGHTWGGRLFVAPGSALDGKFMPVTIDVPGKFAGPAIIKPSANGAGPDGVILEVLGEGPNPLD